MECIKIYYGKCARISGYVLKEFFYFAFLEILTAGIFGKIPLQVFWNGIHHYQMTLLLPLLGSFIPPVVINTILLSDFEIKIIL